MRASRPPVALLLSVALALLFTWGGLTIAYYQSGAVKAPFFQIRG